MTNFRIAVILTCFNRKDLTLASLQSLYQAQRTYNEIGENKLSLSVFLTDDGCTDGTADAILSSLPNEDIHIIQGTGSLYWAGGMRMAWKQALKSGVSWDFYLLINDDTLFRMDAFVELFQTHNYVISQHHKAGVYCGICSSPDGLTVTYGGKKHCKGLFGKAVLLMPTGIPQSCSMTNANILMVSSIVVDSMGIFDDFYTHTNADWAYGIEAGKHGFPVYVTGKVCGLCEYDHPTEIMQAEKVIAMSISERIHFFNHPLRGTKDRLYFMWKYFKLRFFALCFARVLNIFLPHLYYALITKRPNK